MSKIYGYIYITTNLANGMLYVGRHKGEFTDKYLGSGKNILKAIEEYGRENFEVHMLDFACSETELNEMEKEYIKKLNCVEDNRYYNIMDGGHGGLVPLDEESKRDKINKISQKVRNFHSSELGAEFRERFSKIQSGKKYSDETNQKKGSKGESNPNFGNKFGWSGINHPRAIPVKIILPNGCEHSFEYRKLAQIWLKDNYGISYGIFTDLIRTGEPYKTTHSKKKHLEGLTIIYNDKETELNE